MKLAFSGEARYPDFHKGYGLYSKRVRKREIIRFSSYCIVIRKYCASLAERLYNNGMVDLPAGLGVLTTATIPRKAQYRGKTFIGYGKKDWEKGHLDGSAKAFGVVFLPNRKKSQNLRCYGFVTNRALYKRLKKFYESYDCPWVPMEFNDDII